MTVGKPRWTKERLNARGQVLCLDCQRWMSRDAFACPPSRRGVPWPYCRECVRGIDRQRKRSIRGTREWQKDTERRVRQKRRQRANEQQQRREFVQHAILLLRRRGLTKADICRCTNVSFTTLLSWEQGKRRCDTNIDRRLGELLRLTSDFPLSDEPVYRRRLPHPALPGLIAMMAPIVERHPTRSRWS